MEQAQPSPVPSDATDSPITPLLLTIDGPPWSASPASGGWVATATRFRDDEGSSGGEGTRVRDGRVAQGGEAEQGGSPEDIEAARSTFWGEVGCQLRLALPLVGLGLVNIMIVQVALVFLGQLGQGGIPLAAGSLAISFSNILGQAILMGLAGALETLMGQSYGAGQFDKLGATVHRALIFNTLICVPIGVLWSMFTPVLIAMGQDPLTSDYAGTYLRLLIPGLVFNAWLQPLQKFLQIQNVIFPLALCAIVTLGIHIGMTYLFVYPFGLGFKGAAIATSTSFLVNLVLVLIFLYTCNSNLRAKLPSRMTRECLGGWGAFIGTSIPGVGMMMLEFLYFEGIVLASGFLPNPSLNAAALGVQANFMWTVGMVPLGWGIAGSIQVARWVGAGYARLSARACQVASLIAFVWGVFITVTVYLLREVITDIYLPSSGGLGDSPAMLASTQELRSLVVYMLELTCLQLVQDSIQITCQGLIRGLGRQTVAAWICLIVYYLIGTPLSAYLGIVRGMEAPGLWIPTIICESSLVIAYFTLLYRTDWDGEVKRSRALIDKANVHVGAYLPPPPSASTDATLPSQQPRLAPVQQQQSQGRQPPQEEQQSRVETRKPPRPTLLQI